MNRLPKIADVAADEKTSCDRNDLSIDHRKSRIFSVVVSSNENPTKTVNKETEMSRLRIKPDCGTAQLPAKMKSTAGMKKVRLLQKFVLRIVRNCSLTGNC